MSKIQNEPRQIMIFDSNRILLSIAPSITKAAKMLSISPGNISKACNGQLIATGNYYFRYIYDEIELEFSDFGTLQLEEYDKLCGIDRKIYATSKMNRKNWKYNKNHKDNEN